MPPRYSRKAIPYSRNRVYSMHPAKRLHEQTADIRQGHRGFVAHWVKMSLIPAAIPDHQPNPRANKEFARMRRAYERMGSVMRNGDITRTGFVPRLRKERGRVEEIEIPITKGKFFDYMETVVQRGRGSLARGLKSKQKHGESFRLPKNHPLYAQARSRYERMHNQFTFNIGMNAILEVGQDKNGQPTHILLMRRPRTVPVEPETQDFPAGLVREGQSPLEAVRKRSAEEVGTDLKRISTVGPGFKPTDQEVVFALQRIDRLANYNGVVIQRANVSLNQAQVNVERAIEKGKSRKDPWSPTGFYLIPRNPKAIREFVKSHATFMPEVLRLYSFELSRHLRKK